MEREGEGHEAWTRKAEYTIIVENKHMKMAMPLLPINCFEPHAGPVAHDTAWSEKDCPSCSKCVGSLWRQRLTFIMHNCLYAILPCIGHKIRSQVTALNIDLHMVLLLIWPSAKMSRWSYKHITKGAGSFLDLLFLLDCIFALQSGEVFLAICCSLEPRSLICPRFATFWNQNL